MENIELKKYSIFKFLDMPKHFLSTFSFTEENRFMFFHGFLHLCPRKVDTSISTFLEISDCIREEKEEERKNLSCCEINLTQAFWVSSPPYEKCKMAERTRKLEQSFFIFRTLCCSTSISFRSVEGKAAKAEEISPFHS